MLVDLQRPDEATLRQFLLGQLSGADAERVESYVEAHPELANTLESMSTDDALTSALRAAKVGEATDPQVQAAIERLEGLFNKATERTTTNDGLAESQSEHDDDAEDTLTFLAPARGGGELGWLGGYRVLRVLGMGGMGMVLEAEDPKLGRLVAIKVMRPRVATSPKAVKRFLQEARAAATVEHDHIIPIWYIGEDNGVPYIVMPFLKGESLDARAKREGRLPTADIMRIGRETAEGLAEAHAAGLTHRDIKPANLWLEAPRGRVKILDFGLARLGGQEGQLTQSGAIVGTPAFMAPEQARGLKVDGRSDLFSLGAVLYRLATGRNPFAGTDTMSMLMSLATDTPADPRLLNTALPANLADLIMRLLEKDPARRPQTAQEVAGLLTLPRVEALAESGEQRANFAFDQDDATQVDVPMASVGRPERWPRVGWMIGLTAAIMLLLIGGGGLALYKLVFQTKDGTLLVEVDRDVEVRFKNGKLQIYDDTGKQLLYELESSEKNKTLPPGKYQIKVTGADGLKVNTSEFKLEQRGKTKVYVVVDPNWRPALAKKDPTPEARPASYVLRFDGPGIATVPKLSVHDLPEATVEVYVTPTADPPLKPCHIVGIVRQFSIFINPAGGPHWDLGCQSEQWFVGVDTGPPVEKGRRVHLAGVRRGGEIMLFVDGKLVGKKPAPLGQLRTDATTKFWIGGDGAGLDIGQVRLSKSARYTADFTPEQQLISDKETLALYQNNEDTGDVVKDSSGHNHHGNITGAKWVQREGEPPLPFTGSALEFDGKSSYVDIPSLTYDAKSPITIEATYIPSGPEDALTCLVSNAIDRGTPGASLYRLKNDIGFGLFYPKSMGYAEARMPAEPVLRLAGVWNGSHVTTFINGRLSSTRTFTLPNTAAFSPHAFLIGAQDMGAGKPKSYHLAGRLAEIRVSKGARYSANYSPVLRLESDADTLALYHCDEGQGDVLQDSSGKGHHGKIVGAKWVKADGSPVQSVASSFALKFDGKSSYVDIPSLVRDDPWQPVTLEAWAKPDDVTSIGALVVLGGKGRCQLHKALQDWHGADEALRQELIAPFPPDKFSHLALVLTDREMRLYIDGRLVGRKPRDPKARRTASAVTHAWIGGHVDGPAGNPPSWPFAGQVSGARISRIARYDEDFTPPARFDADGDTLALYQFDEGKGDALADSSGHGHHGKIVGAKWVQVPPASFAGVAANAPRLQFDGKTSYAVIPIKIGDIGNYLPNRPFTIEAFFEAGPQRPNVPTKDTPAALLPTVMGYAQIGPLSYLPDQPLGIGWNPARLYSDQPVVPGREYHVALVWDGREAQLYLDGVPQAKGRSVVPPGKAEFDWAPFYVGGIKTTDGSQSHFAGTVHSLRISTSARYREAFVPARAFTPDAQTLGYYRMDEGAGDILIDLSGKGNDGKIVGVKWLRPAPPAKDLFPGELVFYDTFDNPKASKMQVGLSGDIRSDLKDGVYSMVRPTAKIGDGVAGHISADTKKLYDSPNGALAIRVRSLNGNLVISLPGGNTRKGDANWYRYLAFAPNGEWTIGNAEHRMVDGEWKTPVTRELLKSDRADRALGEGKWINVVARWGADDLEVWVSGQRLAMVTRMRPPGFSDSQSPCDFRISSTFARDGLGGIEMDFAAVWTLPATGAPSVAEQRKSLEWVLQAGGFLRLKLGDAEVKLTKGNQLPDGQFTVIEVNLEEMPNFDDTALENLRHIPPVEGILNLGKTQVTNAGLARLPTIPGLLNIRDLPMSNCGTFTDDGLAVVPKLPKLETLGLWGTSITDAGLKHVAGTGLKKLGLHGCKGVTDEGLKQLATCKNLTVLYLGETNVTKAGVLALKKLLPACEITWNEGTLWPVKAVIDPKAIDLLDKIDPARDSVRGLWERIGGEFTGRPNGTGNPTLEVPFQPGDEYDYVVEFTRTSGALGVSLALTHNGRAFEFCLAVSGNKYGFNVVDGKPITQNPDARRGDLTLENGKRHTVKVEVRKDWVAGYLNGQLVAQMKTDYQNLTAPTTSALRDAALIGIACSPSVSLTVHRIAVVEVTGTGKLTPKTSDPDRAAVAALMPLRPTLTIRHGDGRRATLEPGAAMPAGPFRLTAITWVDERGLPADFVAKTLLPAVVNLTELDWLKVPVSFSSAELARLADGPVARNLSAFVCWRMELTADTLAALKKFPKLNHLGFGGETAGDELLGRLKELPKATQMSIHGLGAKTPVTERGYEAIAGLPLGLLSIWSSSPPSNASLKKLAAMKDLRILDLNQTRIDDSALAEIAKFAKLEELDLPRTNITDAGLPALAELRSLRRLDVTSTKVTKAAAEKLSAALPKCKIDYPGGTLPAKN